MFERYTERARRVIFFARYEASQYGSHEINSDHLLLGLVREARALIYKWVPNLQPKAVRKTIDERLERGDPIPTNVDLPLSSDAKNVLRHAADESERLGHHHVGTEHLLLGLLDEENSVAAVLLREAGADPATLRESFGQIRPEPFAKHRYDVADGEQEGMVHSHNFALRSDYVRHFVNYCHLYNWQWNKKIWQPRDVVVDLRSGHFSFDLDLALTSEFQLLKSGWKKDHCLICRWELFETSDPDHGSGYTNGREWLCTACYEKFVQGPGFSPPTNVEFRS